MSEGAAESSASFHPGKREFSSSCETALNKKLRPTTEDTVLEKVDENSSKDCLLSLIKSLQDEVISLRRNLPDLQQGEPATVPRELAKYQPVEDVYMTELLEGLACSTLESLDNDIKAIRLGNGMKISEAFFAKGTLYVRALYNSLLTAIRARDKVVLLSNPGTGKSMLLIYYLARLLNPDIFEDPLPPDVNNSTDIPKVVILHVAGDMAESTVLYLAERKAYRFSSTMSVYSLLKIFDPKTTLYFFEPAGTDYVQPYYLHITTPTLAAVSPQTRRYKDFVKNGARKLYMPVFKEGELVTIGRDMLTQPGFPHEDTELKNAYSDDSIRSRFKLYNGIIRHVLPSSIDTMVDTLASRNAALAHIDPSKLLNRDTIEDETISNYVAIYDVPCNELGVYDFPKLRMSLASPDVVNQQLRANLSRTELADRITFMLQHDDEVSSSSYRGAAPTIYETIIADHLTSYGGIRWRQWISDRGVKKAEEVLQLKLARAADGVVPTYEQLAPNTLYRSLNEQFPFCDLLYKDDDRGSKATLVCIQVSLENTGAKHTVSCGAFEKFCKRLDLTLADARKVITYVFCPHPKLVHGDDENNAVKASVVAFEEGVGLNSYTVWHVSEDYSSSSPSPSPASSSSSSSTSSSSSSSSS